MEHPKEWKSSSESFPDEWTNDTFASTHDQVWNLKDFEQCSIETLKCKGLEEDDIDAFVEGVKTTAGFDSFDSQELMEVIEQVGNLANCPQWSPAQEYEIRELLKDCRLQGLRRVFRRHPGWQSVANKENEEHDQEMLRLSPYN